MPFNPDEFLAETSASEASPKPVEGFDPDAFLSQDVSSEQEANALQTQDIQQEEEFGGTGNQALTALYSVGRTLGTPTKRPSITMDGKEVPMGPEPIISPEMGEQLRQANPMSSAVGTLAGLVLPGGQGSALSHAGEMIAQKVLPQVVEKGILAGMERTAVKFAAENALFQAGDETSKMMMENPNQSVGSAIANIGLAGVIGGIAGAGFGSVSPLWKATTGGKASQLAADFRGRLKEHIDMPDQAGALGEELTNYYKAIKDSADEVYGPIGIKAQEISTLLPKELSPKISSQLEQINLMTESGIKQMVDKGVPERYINKYVNDLNTFQKAVTAPKSTPEQIFNAAQDLKQTLQGYSKGNFGPFAVPSYHEAYDFLNITKSMGRNVRTALEDSSIWGKAATRQQAINKAFSEYLPALKDFEKKFTSEIAGERIIDPGKINTYINQLGKPNAELKQVMLDNFVKASEKYKQVLSDTHANLGIESPIPTTSTNMIHSTLKDQSHGAKLADLFIKHSSGVVGKGLGAVVGGAAGVLSHIPLAGHIGALLGEHALGPLFKSLLPALAKPILEKEASGVGLRAATEYGTNIFKGQKLSESAIKKIFKGETKILPESKRPTEETRHKIEAALNGLQKDSTKLMNASQSIGHYLPNHAASIGAVTMNAVNFLNSIRPQNAPQAPLDPPKPISDAIKSQYERVLDIAQQPLIVLESISNGTLTSHDIIAIQTLYPDLYRGLQQKIMVEMVDHVAKGEEVPYDTRLGLSLFMGQPLDSTMKPDAILSAQPTPKEETPMETGQGKKPSQSASSNALKTAKTGRTQTQASEAMHVTGKA